MSTSLEMLLFTKDHALVEEADQAGLDGFIIDWEDHTRFQQEEHQAESQDVDTPDDLKHTSTLTDRPVWCRINQPGAWTKEEVDLAIALGADLILLPMVRRPEEVEAFLALVSGRAQTGILVETVEACTCAPQLAALPLDRVYVGLLDLSISRGGGGFFAPFTDGTAEQLRNTFHATSFGIGGLTTVDCGAPMPSIEIMAHLHRLGCDFTFLRNAFKRDIEGRDMAEEVLRMRAAWNQLTSR